MVEATSVNHASSSPWKRRNGNRTLFRDHLGSASTNSGGFCQDPDHPNTFNPDDLETALEGMGDICNTVAVIVNTLVINSTVFHEMTDLQKVAEDIREELTKWAEMLNREGSAEYQRPVFCSGFPGRRPRFEINKSIWLP